MTSPAGSTEPTAEQVEAATALVVEWGSDDLSPGRLRNMVARALADAVTAERERVRDEAGWQQAVDWHAGYEAGKAARPKGLLSRIREVAG